MNEKKEETKQKFYVVGDGKSEEVSEEIFKKSKEVLKKHFKQRKYEKNRDLFVPVHVENRDIWTPNYTPLNLHIFSTFEIDKEELDEINGTDIDFIDQLIWSDITKKITTQEKEKIIDPKDHSVIKFAEENKGSE